MTIRVTREQGGYGYVTCKSEQPIHMGIVRLFDYVPAEAAQIIAERHDKDTDGTHDITSGRQRLTPLDPALMRKAQALQEARIYRKTHTG